MSASTIHVGSDDGGAGYDVVIAGDLSGAGGETGGSPLVAALADLLGEGVSRVAVIHPIGLHERGKALRQALADAGYNAHAVAIPDGEAAKDVAVLSFCWGVLGRAGFTRSDAVVTLGGGATTDAGGFVAASWLRGVKVVHVPTTLLAMVDAAVGGKTGLNTAEGKNLVGAFHEPAGVLCDLSMLSTLPRNELVSGMAEVIKCGFIADAEILAIVQRAPMSSLITGAPELRDLVERAVRVKAEVVSQDLRETAGSRAGAGHPGREALNYGHTLGHAIEKAERYQYRHGAAISIGMVFVAEVARLAGRLDDEVADLHAELLGSVGLPVRYDSAPWADLLAAMRVDKKSRGDLLRLVILEAQGRPVILQGPDTQLLERAFAVVSGRSGLSIFD